MTGNPSVGAASSHPLPAIPSLDLSRQGREVEIAPSFHTDVLNGQRCVLFVRVEYLHKYIYVVPGTILNVVRNVARSYLQVVEVRSGAVALP